MQFALKCLSRTAASWGPLALLAFASFAAAAGLALHHPLYPVAASVLVCACAMASALREGLWLAAIPACLPWLNFSPWTGWLIFDEFDLLVLAMYAGAYARMAWRARQAPADPVSADRLAAGLLLAVGVSGTLALLRGLQDAGGLNFGWYQGYTDPLNSVRVFKSLLWGLLLWPLLRDVLHSSPVRACWHLGCGMVLGLCVVVLAVLWERIAYAELLDFRQVYRTTALFWEMHVGGGAIDAYLALAMPFSLWALGAARGAGARTGAAALAILTVYACVSTFSRGVYAAFVLCVVVVGLMELLQRRKAPVPTAFGPRASRGWAVMSGWHVYAALALLLVLLLMSVLGPRTFMTKRLVHTDKVWAGRMAHWTSATGLLQSPADWLMGLGLGRFPARFDDAVPGGKFPGHVQWHGGTDGAAPEGAYVTLQGPATDPDLEGLFALTQRVAIKPGRRYQIELDVRAPSATALVVEVCERHLLYDGACQGNALRVPATQGSWRHLRINMRGEDFAAAPLYAPRLGMLALSAPETGAAVDVSHIRLLAGGGELVSNGSFGAGLAQWFPAAQYYFLPWHADSLYLELLVERGLPGLVLQLAVVALALWRLLHEAPTRPLKWPALAPYLAASLGGLLLVGCVSSVMDVPRVAWLFWLVLLFSLAWARAPTQGRVVSSSGTAGESHRLASEPGLPGHRDAFAYPARR